MAVLSKRVISIKRENCVACGTCIKECPRNAVSVYKGCYAVVDLQLCVGCGKCAKMCPTGCMETAERDA